MTTHAARATSPLDSSSLVARAQAGDEEAFAVLVEQHRHTVYRTAWAILRNEADALDAAQETFIGAWRDLPRLRDVERFDAWLTGSVVNRCRTTLRTRRRTSIREIAIADTDRPAGSPVSGTVDGSLEDSDAIRHAFDQLSADHRTYLVLHYVEGRPISEIAQIVRAPAGTVKWRLSEARRALERRLARENR